MDLMLQIILTLISFVFSYLLIMKKQKNEIYKMKLEKNKEIEKMKIATQETIKLKTIELTLSQCQNNKQIEKMTITLLKNIIEEPETKK